jgi:eukaryotic-like serine/threonine-protein kinase
MVYSSILSRVIPLMSTHVDQISGTAKLKGQAASFEVAGDFDEQSVANDIPPPLIDHSRYKILGRLGEGGMGVVYKAEHRVMGRTVALKVLSAGMMSSNQDAIDRFRREVRLASRLSHPNIVTAFDADEAGGLHFLVMEYVDGLSLDRVVSNRGPLPISTACTMIRQAAIGLQHAHEKGMVHRDIKPHNLMLTNSGQVKILDFGLARIAAADGTDPSSPTAMAITNPQVLVGTPDFLSPEQARCSQALDIRSDLYSLGCTLFYLLTGKPPFEGVGAYAKMIAHFKEPPPDLCQVRPDTPAELGEIFQKLMAKSPGDRYQTPRELAEALMPFAEQDPQACKPEAGGQSNPRRKGLSNGKLAAFAETPPARVTEISSKVLPMASEYQTRVVNTSALALSKTALSQQAEPASKRWMLPLGLLAVLGAILVGLGLWFNSDDKSNSGGEETTRGAVAQTASQPASDPPADPPEDAPSITPTTTQVPETPTAPPPRAPITTPTIDPPKPAPKPPASTPSSVVHVTRKKQALLLVPPEYAYSEYSSLTDAFKAHNVSLITASAEKRPLEGFRYVKGDKTIAGSFKAQYTLKEVTAPFLDSVDAVIVMPGEMKTFTQTTLSGLDVKHVLEKAVQKKKVIGAIGSGVVVLATHGLLEHAEASIVPNRAAALVQLKAKAWKDDPKVVIDLPFITAGEFNHSRAVVDEVIKAIPDNVKR